MKSQIDCFGEFTAKKQSCVACEFREACEFSLKDTIKRENLDRKWINGFKKLIPEILANPEKAEPTSDELVYSIADMAEMLRMSLEISRNKLLKTCLLDKLRHKINLSDMANKRGMSRQNLHNRIGKALCDILGYHKNRIAPVSKKVEFLKMTHLQARVFHLRSTGNSWRVVAKIMNTSTSQVLRIAKQINRKIKVDTCIEPKKR